MAKQNPNEVILPNNIEAERSVLGAILVHNPAIEAVSDTLLPSDFFHAHHQKLYTAMLELHEDEKPIDEIHLLEWLDKKHTLDAAGGIAYISSLADGRPNVSNVVHHAAIIHDKARIRNLIKQAEFVQRRAIEGTEDFDALQEQFQTAFNSTAAISTNGNGHLGCNGLDFLTKTFPPHEHLIDGLLPRGASGMIIALPHRMKSFVTMGLALACTVAGEKILGKLNVPRPLKTMIVQVEDPPEIVQKRMRDFVTTTQFKGCDLKNVWVVERKEFAGFTPVWAKKLVSQALAFKADVIILDVLRRIFEGHGDLNSPIDTSKFLELIDAVRDVTGAAVILVHHENKKDAELMSAAAGSYNLPGWAQVMIQIKRKTMRGTVTTVEIEVDNKLGESIEPMRAVLDMSSPFPLRLEAIEDGEGLADAIEEMGDEWNIRTICEVMGIPRTSAQRRIKKWMADGLIVKVSGGKKGNGGLATYKAASKF